MQKLKSVWRGTILQTAQLNEKNAPAKSTETERRKNQPTNEKQTNKQPHTTITEVKSIRTEQLADVFHRPVMAI